MKMDEINKNEIVESFEKSGYLFGVEDDQKVNLSILLRNCQLHSVGYPNQNFSLEQMFWLTKESWNRIKFKKMISIQPMTAPASVVNFMNDNTLISEAILADVKKFDFSIFSKSAFESMKYEYANVVAKEIDSDIVQRMNARQNYNALVNCKTNLKNQFDYIIAPSDTIKILKESRIHSGIDFFEIETILDDELNVVSVAGNYNSLKMNLPVYCPYIFLFTGPKKINGTFSLLTRSAWFTKEYYKDKLKQQSKLV